MIFIKNKKYMILISLMLFLLIVKIAFPSNNVKYQKSNVHEVNQSVIKAPSDSNTSMISKDGERYDLRIVNFNIYSLLTITLSIIAVVFILHYLCRRLLFEGCKKIYYISTVYFNVGKYKDMSISSKV